MCVFVCVYVCVYVCACEASVGVLKRHDDSPEVYVCVSLCVSD